ncbi:UNVERIFIED_CONTAM: hypothetical protein PYX00_007153 [Menopon gallinae]|uniref:Cytochrome P450 n=1 Tax=Menopon gallinae TaxID=328185 RepID=A0AAW2HIK6_9NEOP
MNKVIYVIFRKMNATVYALAMNILRRWWFLYVTVLVLSCMVLIRYIVKRYAFVRKLSWIPGPPGLPILGNALSLTGGQVDFFRLLVKYSKEYDGLFKLWIGTRPFVFITTAEYAQPILSSTIHIDKSYEYKFLYPWVGNGLVTSNGSTWHEKRKFLTPAFHYSILEDFIEPIIEQSQILVERLLTKVDQPPFNVVSFTKLFALDVICVTAMGKCVNAQKNEDHKYVKAVDGINTILQRRFITPWLKPDFIFSRCHLGRKQVEYVKTINDFVDNVIADRKRSMRLNNMNELPDKKRKHKAFLELILAAAERGDMLTDNEIRDEVNTFMFAGHDTTSVTLAWCLYVLGKHPEVQVKILDEYKTIIENDIPKYKDIQNLEYLESIIKEVMRLYPTVPLIARDIKSVIYTGKKKAILPGVTALIFTPSLHRNPDYFPAPNKFEPERFLGRNKDYKNPFTFIPFSAGPRNCIGSKFAMIELKIVLHMILKNYVVISVDNEEDLNLYSEIVLLNKGGIRVQLRKRY